MEENFINILKNTPENQNIRNAFVKSYNIINNPQYKKIICSISGGSDSDIMLDLCSKIDFSNKIDYVWFDTGLEYQATKDHLRFLEEKYHIKIKFYLFSKLKVL